MFRFFGWATLVAAFSLAGCAHDPITGSTVDVLVKGTPATLSAFDAALQPRIKGYIVGCLHCDELGTTAAPTSVTYSFYDSQVEVYEKFGAAWNQLPAVPDPKPEMTFFRGMGAPSCSVKPACYNLAPCLQYARCTTDPAQRSCTGPC